MQCVDHPAPTLDMANGKEGVKFIRDLSGVAEIRRRYNASARGKRSPLFTNKQGLYRIIRMPCTGARTWALLQECEKATEVIYATSSALSQLLELRLS